MARWMVVHDVPPASMRAMRRGDRHPERTPALLAGVELGPQLDPISGGEARQAVDLLDAQHVAGGCRL